MTIKYEGLPVISPEEVKGNMPPNVFQKVFRKPGEDVTIYLSPEQGRPPTPRDQVKYLDKNGLLVVARGAEILTDKVLKHNNVSWVSSNGEQEKKTGVPRYPTPQSQRDRNRGKWPY